MPDDETQKKDHRSERLRAPPPPSKTTMPAGWKLEEEILSSAKQRNRFGRPLIVSGALSDAVTGGFLLMGFSLIALIIRLGGSGSSEQTAKGASSVPPPVGQDS